jgi:hypothetical protein
MCSWFRVHGRNTSGPLPWLPQKRQDALHLFVIPIPVMSGA